MKLIRTTIVATGALALVFSVAAIAATSDSKQGSTTLSTATSTDGKSAMDPIAWWPPKCPPYCATQEQEPEGKKEA